MKLKCLLKPAIIFLALSGMLFGAIITPNQTPVYADETTTSETTKDLTCYNQTGAVGWVVCPVTEFVSGAVDKIYDLISQFLVIKPIGDDDKSPIHIVWEYVRNVTNIVFVIFLLVVILSQLTGLGISSYGIKKTIPRIIIAAILVNLSFIICSLALDFSNIIGASLVDFFHSIEENAAANATIEAGTTTTPTWAAVASVILGGAGTIAIGGVAIGAAGGFGALLFLLIPLVLGALISVCIALLMVALRQALVVLLVMVSPLAFVAYLLPNTEKIFQKWKQLFVAMIVFYPLFSLLFGACSLAGWAILASAKDLLWLLIGLAVQVLPLCLCIPLMKTSGTFLDKASATLDKLNSKATGGTKNALAPYREKQRARYFAEKPSKYNLPRKTAQALQNRKYRRQSDTNHYQKMAEERGKAFTSNYQYSDNAYNRFRGRTGKVTKRGEKLYASQAQTLDYQATAKHNESAFESGISNQAINTRQKDRLDKADVKIIQAADRLRDETTHARSVNFDNLRSYEKRINDALEANTQGQFSARYQSILQTVGADNPANLTDQNRENISSIVANAISAKQKVEKEITEDYANFFNASTYTSNVDKYARESIVSKNKNAMGASVETLMKRGDTDKVMQLYSDLTRNIGSNSPEDIAMQTRLADIGFQYKEKNAVIWGYSKCLAKSRNKSQAMHEAIDSKLAAGTITQAEATAQHAAVTPSFFTFDDYLNRDPNGSAKQFGVDVDTILGELNESNIASTQDKTSWDFQKANNELLFTDKQRRSAIFNFANDGEQYRYLIDTHLGKNGKWEDKATRKKLVFTDQAALNQARANVQNIISGCSAQQISKFKSDSLNTFATVLSNHYTTNQDGSITFDLTNQTDMDRIIIDGLNNMQFSDRDRITSDLQRRARKGELDSMNVNVRQYLNAVFNFENT